MTDVYLAEIPSRAVLHCEDREVPGRPLERRGEGEALDDCAMVKTVHDFHLLLPPLDVLRGEHIFAVRLAVPTTLFQC